VVSRQTVLITTIVLMAALGWAQDTRVAKQTKQTAAAGNDKNSGTPSEPAAVPDNKPPSGALPLGLGIGGEKLLNISLNASQSWDSSPPVALSTPKSWEPEPSFGGALRLSFDTIKSQTRLNYSGNVLAFPNGDPTWRTYQDVGFSQSVNMGRWTLTAADTFNYSPNSPFGGYGLGLTANSGAVASSTINPQYVPNQSILTTYAASYFNTALGQVEYGLTHRLSWTATGSYGIMRFPDSALYDSNQLLASTGYNHSLTARDAIFGTYNYSEFHYTLINSSFTSQNIQFGYSHKVTGRMSFQASGGPQFTNTTSLGTKQKQIRFSGAASLAYSRGYTSLALTYFAGTTAGSGVLTGAQTQNVQFTVGRTFSRAWTTDLSCGYSNNSGLVQQQSYDSFYVAPAIRRAVTRNLGLSFNYSYQRQLTQSACSGPVCGTVSRNLLTAGIDYRFRPIHLE
jgi:hypothetical protein